MKNNWKLLVTLLTLIPIIPCFGNFQFTKVDNFQKLSNFDFKNLNLNFANPIHQNYNENINIIANVNWSQWNNQLPSVETTILDINIVIDKYRLPANTATGLFDFLNDYSLHYLNSHEPFYLFTDILHSELRGVWDHDDNRVIGGWINEFWRINNFPNGIDKIYLQSKTKISFDFVKINN